MQADRIAPIARTGMPRAGSDALPHISSCGASKWDGAGTLIGEMGCLAVGMGRLVGDRRCRIGADDVEIASHNTGLSSRFLSSMSRMRPYVSLVFLTFQ